MIRSASRCGPSATLEIGKRERERFDDGGMVAEHRDRQIVKPGFFGEHCQERFDYARAETVADDHAADIA
jgi:hypothetical protein